MKSSPTIGKLAEALAKAQGEMESAKKDSLNPHFKSKYADLASIIDAIKGPISKNGLSYVQPITKTETGIIIETVLMHSSGEWISGEVPLILSKNDMQGLGSSITYGRRFGLASIVGIAQDDDDGNTANAKPEKPEKPSKPPAQPPRSTPGKPVQTDERKKSLQSLALKHGWTNDDIVKELNKLKKKFEELNQQEFEYLMNHFGKRKGDDWEKEVSQLPPVAGSTRDERDTDRAAT